MDPGSVVSGVTAVVKIIGFIVEHSKKGTPKYDKEYKDSVMKFKGVDTRGTFAAWWDEWYWIDQDTERNQKQFVYQDMSFYLPSKATQTQLNWVEHLLSKDTVNLQDLKNWFELLEDSTQFYFKNIYLFDEIVETARKVSNPHAVEPTKYYLRKRAHIVLANDDQVLSAPGVDIVKQLGDVGLMQKLLYVWKNIPGPAGVTAKQITVGNANTVWVLDNNGSPWKWNGGSSWKKASGTLVSISVASDGTLWGTNAANVVYRYNAANDKWAANVPAGMKQVAAVNASSAWGVDSKGTGIYYWSGTGEWQKKYDPTGHVAVSSDGTVWGAGAPIVYIALGAKDNVWGVNASDQIFKWDGKTWVSVPGGLRTIDVGNDGTVMGTNAKGQIYQRVSK